MPEVFQALEIQRDGKLTGRWRMTVRTLDPDSVPVALCRCEDGHESEQAARQCREALAATPPERDSRTERLRTA